MLHRANKGSILISFLLILLLNLSTPQDLKFLEVNNDFEEIMASVKYNKKTNEYSIKFGEYDLNAPAFCKYTKSMESIGWDKLSISSYDSRNHQYTDSVKSYAMGYLEGYLTAPRIWNHFLNMKGYYFYDTKGEIPEKTREFLNLNLSWMKEKSNEEMNNDPYWYHVHTIIRQMEGLIDGYNSVAGRNKQISYAELQVANSFGDITELKYWDASKRPKFFEMKVSEINEHIKENSHCSALIKLSPDFSDVWFGHNTWTSYPSMTRIVKEYRFVSNRYTEKSHAVAFSSYPGTLTSVDDFYITDQDLYVTETTNQIYFDQLYEKLTPASNLSWIRAMVANRLSSGGEQWTRIFARYNSGTYNNQYQILDLKMIDTKEKIVRDNALWIIEQMPGFTDSADVTEILKSQGYWPSYNSAYFKSIREKSGYDEILRKRPELKSAIDYEECTRARIFRRDQSKVDGIETFKKLMRYNNYKHDPLSEMNPWEGIAARGDLSLSNPVCRGATDAKIASIHDIKGKRNKTFNIISGPTTDQQEPFDSLTAKCAASNKFQFHGIKQKFNYGWIEFNTSLF